MDTLRNFIENEAVRLVEQDKSRFIKPLYDSPFSERFDLSKLPSEETLTDFFNTHNNIKFNWQGKKNNPSDFEDYYTNLLDVYFSYNSNSQKKKEAKTDVKKLFDPKNIVYENEMFVFVVMQSYEDCLYADSFNCGGTGARWCIGYEQDSSYWDDYSADGNLFCLAIGKEDKEKYMLQMNSSDDQECQAWIAEDDPDNTIPYYNWEEDFGVSLQQIAKLTYQKFHGTYTDGSPIKLSEKFLNLTEDSFLKRLLSYNKLDNMYWENQKVNYANILVIKLDVAENVIYNLGQILFKIGKVSRTRTVPHTIFLDCSEAANSVMVIPEDYNDFAESHKTQIGYFPNVGIEHLRNGCKLDIQTPLNRVKVSVADSDLKSVSIVKKAINPIYLKDFEARIVSTEFQLSKIDTGEREDSVKSMFINPSLFATDKCVLGMRFFTYFTNFYIYEAKPEIKESTRLSKHIYKEQLEQFDESSPVLKRLKTPQEANFIVDQIRKCISQQDFKLENRPKNIEFLEDHGLSEYEVMDICYGLSPIEFVGVLENRKNPNEELYLFVHYEKYVGNIYIKISLAGLTCDVISFHEETGSMHPRVGRPLYR